MRKHPVTDRIPRGAVGKTKLISLTVNGFQKMCAGISVRGLQVPALMALFWL